MVGVNIQHLTCYYFVLKNLTKGFSDRTCIFIIWSSMIFHKFQVKLWHLFYLLCWWVNIHIYTFKQSHKLHNILTTKNFVLAGEMGFWKKVSIWQWIHEWDLIHHHHFVESTFINVTKTVKGWITVYYTVIICDN